MQPGSHWPRRPAGPAGHRLGHLLGSCPHTNLLAPGRLPSPGSPMACLASPASSLGHRAQAYLAGRKRSAQPWEAWSLGKPGWSFVWPCGLRWFYLEAVPGLGPLVSPPVAHLSSQLQGGAEEGEEQKAVPSHWGHSIPQAAAQRQLARRKRQAARCPHLLLPAAAWGRWGLCGGPRWAGGFSVQARGGRGARWEWPHHGRGCHWGAKVPGGRRRQPHPSRAREVSGAGSSPYETFIPV